ncbi:hypothetical protein ACSBR2_035667 [Camellia fascicularis]
MELADEVRLIALLSSAPSLNPVSADSLVWDSVFAVTFYHLKSISLGGWPGKIESKLLSSCKTLASLISLPPSTVLSAILPLNLLSIFYSIAHSLGPSGLMCCLNGGFNGASQNQWHISSTGGWVSNLRALSGNFGELFHL